MSKKVIAVLMAAMVSASLAGCSLSSSKNNDNTKNTEIIEEKDTDTTGKWSRDFTLKEFTEVSDDLIAKVEKKTKEYGLEYTEEEVVRENNEKTVNVDNENAEKGRLQGMYFSRILYGEDLKSGQIKLKILLNFDGEKALKDNSVDLGSTSIAKYAEVLTGVSDRNYNIVNAKVLAMLKSSSGEGYFEGKVEGLTEGVTVTKEYIVYSLQTTKYDFKNAEQ